MKILMELVPRPSIRYVNEIVSLTKELVDCYDIPESPLGIPSVNSISTGVYIKAVTGKPVVSHIRLYDVNRVALLSLAYAAYTYGVDGVVLTHGDKPVNSIIVNELNTEKAIKVLRKEIPKLRIGAIISLRYPFEKIIRRIGIGADFFLVIRLDTSNFDKYLKILNVAEKEGVKLYPYVIIATEKNKSVLEKLQQPYLRLEELKEFFLKYSMYLHGVVVSVPLDEKNMVKALTIIRESLDHS